MPGLPPAANNIDNVLYAKLIAALESKGADYKPRTHHLSDSGEPLFVNRLILETSPYLLQHAHNPVNWFPWGDEAFALAAQTGRPVFLSVGYSTCHWCHVMEGESFEDIAIARYINEHYVPIKVDREERPDVDAIYMSAVQAMTGRGGWPMSVWLDDKRRPFYGGTYFPARDGDRGSPTGFLTILKKLYEAYYSKPKEMASFAQRLTDSIKDQSSLSSGGEVGIGDELLVNAGRYYESGFDEIHGGISGAPKFPSSLPVRTLLRIWKKSGDEKILHMAEHTLKMMAAGGMYDHVAGGFHRYSVDDAWLVPHFEKMLYDNALLTLAYLDGYRATGNEDFARVAKEILEYAGRDMLSPDGAFYSATDADSLDDKGRSEEGWFFTWTPDEIEAALNPEEARAAAAYYNVSSRGNFEGRNILHVEKSMEDMANNLGMAEKRLRELILSARQKLYAKRNERPKPLRDEKIITSWNGLMISANAQAGFVFADSGYLEKASNAADFILANMEKDGRLYRSYKDGEARHTAYLDDYAFFIAGLLDLYEASGTLKYMAAARRLQGALDTHYLDEAGGGYFMTADDHEELLTRQKPYYDGAEPSGNSVAVMNLLRFYGFTTDDAYRRKAEAV